MIKKLAVWIIGLGTLAGCHTSSKPLSEITFDKEGHRGCRGLMPENTIPAMLHAIDLDVTTLEMDTHITADSQVVVSHDAWFNPDITTRPDGGFLDSSDHSYILYRMRYDSISRFDVGSKPYSKFPRQARLNVAKPLLNSLIDSVESYCSRNNKRVLYNIEVKSAPSGDNILHPQPANFVDLLMAVLKTKQITPYVTIQSFDFRSLQYLHNSHPQMKTSALVEDFDKRPFEEVIKNLGFVPTVYSPHFSLVTKELVDACHEKGMRIVPWTVNDLPTMKRLKEMGVDGLISDYPDLYKDL